MATESDSTKNWHDPPPFDPEPYALAVLAAQLSGGENPEKHLHAAYKLYCAANCELEQRNMSIALNRAGREMDGVALEKGYAHMWLDLNSDWDELREYLSVNGLSMKKAETVRRNLREFFKEKGQDKKLIALKSSLGRNGRVRLLETTIDEFIRYRKKRKSEGGKKSHRTKKKRAARKTTAKK